MRAALILATLALSAGCPSDTPSVEADTDTDTDADTDADTDTDADADTDTDTEPVWNPEFVAVAGILTARCANCHGPTGPGGFSMPQGAASTLEEIQSVLDGSGLVVPGNAAASTLYTATANNHGGTPATERATLQGWIDGGASFTL